MDNFFVRNFIKNPIGLTVLGIVVAVSIGPSIYTSQGSLSWVIIGIIIAVIGAVWFVLRKRREQQFVIANLPYYREVVDTLKKNGYEVNEFEHKGDRVRSSVYLNGNHLGEVFLIAPGKRYAQFREIEDITKKEFEYAYSKKFKKTPDIDSSYWPDTSLIGFRIEESVENYSEKGKWLEYVKSCFREVDN